MLSSVESHNRSELVKKSLMRTKLLVHSKQFFFHTEDFVENCCTPIANHLHDVIFPTPQSKL